MRCLSTSSVRFTGTLRGARCRGKGPPLRVSVLRLLWRDDLEHRIEIVEQSEQLDHLAGIARDRDLPRCRRGGEGRLLEHD